MTPIRWLVNRILDFDPSLNRLEVVGHPDVTPEQWLAIRLKWGMDHGFVWLSADESGDPKQAVCFRPVNDLILDKIVSDYAGSIWDFDLYGNILFIDFRYGKGSMPLVWDMARSTGKPDIAWFYRDRLRRYKMADIPRMKGWQRDG